MTETEAAYIAGIIDGEGCISLTTFYRAERGRTEYKLMVCVGNTNRKLMQYLQGLFGGDVWQRARIGNSKTLFMWHPKRKDLENFLRTIRPYLVLKTEQADIALAFLGRLKNGQFPGNSPGGLRSPLTNSELSERAVLLDRMQVLNRRGVPESERIH